MTTITFKTTYPLAEVRERMITEINKLDGVHLTGEFIMEIPRHNLMKLTIIDDSHENVFKLGRLIQVLDNPDL